MEREWMSALIDGNIDAIHHMLMGDSSYVNKKGFLHGWVRRLMNDIIINVSILDCLTLGS